MKGKLHTNTVSYHSNLHVMWVSIVAWEYVYPLNPEITSSHCYTSFKCSLSLTPTGVIVEIRVNDTIIGDPLYEVPVIINGEGNTMSLCYEIHGEPREHFNLISDTCVSVNALYSSMINPSNGNFETLETSLNLYTNTGIELHTILIYS